MGRLGILQNNPASDIKLTHSLVTYSIGSPLVIDKLIPVNSRAIMCIDHVYESDTTNNCRKRDSLAIIKISIFTIFSQLIAKKRALFLATAEHIQRAIFWSTNI